MVKVTTLPGTQGYEAELTDIDLPGAVGYGTGATPEQAVAELRQKVAAYIAELQQLDFTIVRL